MTEKRKQTAKETAQQLFRELDKALDGPARVVFRLRNGVPSGKPMSLRQAGEKLWRSRQYVLDTEREYEDTVSISRVPELAVKLLEKTAEKKKIKHAEYSEITGLLENPEDGMMILAAAKKYATGWEDMPGSGMLIRKDMLTGGTSGKAPLEDAMLARYGHALSIETAGNLPPLYAAGLSRFYYRRPRSVYIHNGEDMEKLASMAAAECMPEGFSPGSKECYKKFAKAWAEKIAGKDTCPSMAVVAACITKNPDWTQHSRGTWAFTPGGPPELDRNLAEKMIADVEAGMPKAFYADIFQKYSSELEKYGIANRQQLKAALDPLLPEKYRRCRDSVKPAVQG